MEILSFIFLSLFLVTTALIYTRKDGNNFIQPHAFYTANIFVLLILFPIVQFYFSGLFLDKSGIVKMNFMVGLSYLSFSLGFFWKKKKAAALLAAVVKRFNISSVPRGVFALHISLMILFAGLLFIYLTHASGFGFVSWLTHPRQGYQNYRLGNGHLYILSLAFLNFSYLLILFFRIKNGKKLVLVTLLFAGILYFYGSKGFLVFAIFEAVVFYNFFIRKLRFQKLAIIFACLFSVFVVFYTVYRPAGARRALFSEILVYTGYYNEGRRFFADFNKEFQYAYGQEYLDNLWLYVPRAFYPDKPKSYGLVKYVVEHYYPGAGESGNTPSFGGPVEEYLNFGILGVVIVGLLQGYTVSLLYCYFLKYKNFLGFVLLSSVMGFSIFPVMNWPLYAILWYIINIYFLLFHKGIFFRKS